MRYSVAVVIEVGSAVRCRADADLAVAVKIKGERVVDKKFQDRNGKSDIKLLSVLKFVR